MSFAIYAAPFNGENTENKQDIISQKRQHNKTQKRYNAEPNNINKSKVSNILETIHNNTDEEDNNLGDFSPPPKPESSGVNKTTDTENAMKKTSAMNTEMFSTIGTPPQPSYEENNYDLNDYHNYGSKESNEMLLKKMLPTYGASINRAPANIPYYNNGFPQAPSGSQDDVLVKKLNYMIHLLEEQQDERTNNVTEEVVLYSFLGIFIIFVIDSFVRVGKYVR